MTVETVVAIDFGRSRVGVAACTGGELVFPVTTIEQRSRRATLAAVAEHLRELDAQKVIVGWPLNPDGTVGPSAAAAAKFAAEVRLTTGLIVELHDERLSSFEARERLREAGHGRKRDGRLDAVAACVILESWLRSRPR